MGEFGRERVPSTGRIVVLSGTSCAGKTSLGRALASKSSLSGAYWYCLDMDVALWGIPKEWWVLPGHRGEHANRGVSHTPGVGSEFHVGSDARRTLDAFRVAARHMAEGGANVVITCIVFDRTEWEQWQRIIGPLGPTWVAVRAPADVLRRRETERNESYWPGFAEDYVELAHRFPAYDLEVDTTAGPPDVLAEQLAGNLGFA